MIQVTEVTNLPKKPNTLGQFKYHANITRKRRVKDICGRVVVTLRIPFIGKLILITTNQRAS